ncbi:hypothetical protein [Desulfoscipio gibsoniae]|uniref:Uncharacterized protein n=1 Tax=Desulfoscipio gibsoniae DSM 7213 TaxID=767817 RepID=R4KPM4_9FIRM|nr:hypothetical protein [Desulfoscipio gibsoniae]AGL01601.1 hypothetical protein Desgi_2170 [Desulfoscipio gibsoniae DSM 7213]
MRPEQSTRAKKAKLLKPTNCRQSAAAPLARVLHTPELIIVHATGLGVPRDKRDPVTTREVKTMYFKNKAHRELFEQYRWLSQAGNDREYNSLCYLLAAIGKPLERYFKPRNVAIRGIMAAFRGWSSGEIALVKLCL